MEETCDGPPAQATWNSFSAIQAIGRWPISLPPQEGLRASRKVQNSRLDITTHRLKYALDQYRVRPRMRVGITRVWTQEDLPRIKSALSRVAANRKGGCV